MLLSLCLMALAEDPTPAPTPPPPESTTAPETPTETPEAPVVAPPESETSQGEEEIEIWAVPEVARARDALVQRLRSEGYTRSERKDGYTVYHNDIPYHPRVILHDDGWVELKREKVRIHAPGHRFASEGSKLEYLWCVIPVAWPACISPGGQIISKRKLDPLKADVYDNTHEEVRALNDAVAATALYERISKEIPLILQSTWESQELSASEKKERILALWDSRTDTPEGEEVRRSIEAFMIAVIQSSSTPYTSKEVEEFNARRQAPRPLELPIRP